MDPYEGTARIEGAAMHLEVNQFTFRTAWKREQVPHEYIGGQLRFRLADLDAWRKAHPTAMRPKQREAA
jgi:hypothetical protein